MALLLLLPHWLGPLAAIVTMPPRSTVRRVVVVDIADRAADFTASTMALAGGRGEAFGGPDADPRPPRPAPVVPEALPAALASRASAPDAPPDPDPAQPRHEPAGGRPAAADQPVPPAASISAPARRDPGEPRVGPEPAPVTAPSAPSAALAPTDPVPADGFRA